MSYCSMFGCNNSFRNSKGKVKFFRFPREISVQTKWITACRRSDTINVNTARICSIHFDEDSFYKSLRQQLLNYSPRNSRQIKADAVPSINLPSLGERVVGIHRRGRRKWKLGEYMLEEDKITVVSNMCRKSAEMDDMNVSYEEFCGGAVNERPQKDKGIDSHAYEDNSSGIEVFIKEEPAESPPPIKEESSESRDNEDVPMTFEAGPSYIRGTSFDSSFTANPIKEEILENRPPIKKELPENQDDEDVPMTFEDMTSNVGGASFDSSFTANPIKEEILEIDNDSEDEIDCVAGFEEEEADPLAEQENRKSGEYGNISEGIAFSNPEGLSDHAKVLATVIKEEYQQEYGVAAVSTEP